MTLSLHWWFLPLALFAGYAYFGIWHIRRSSPFDMISGLVSVGFLIAALAVIAGHYL